MSKGWIKLHRRIMDSEIYRDPLTCHVFRHCLLSAAYEPCRKRIRGRVYDLQPGQLATTREQFAEETGMKEAEVRTSWNCLQDLGMIRVESKRGQAGSCITVCNWNQYQGQEERDNGFTNSTPTPHQLISNATLETQGDCDNGPRQKHQLNTNSQPNNIKGEEVKKVRRTTLVENEPGQKELAERLAFERWNPFATAHGLATVRTVTPARAKKVLAREKDGTLQHFDEALERIAESDFLLGKNNRDWRVTFDYLIRSTDTFLRVLEGAHGSARKTNAGNEPESFRGSTDFDGL